MVKQLLLISFLLLNTNQAGANSYRAISQLIIFARNSGKMHEVIKYAQKYVGISLPTTPCQIKTSLNQHQTNQIRKILKLNTCCENSKTLENELLRQGYNFRK
jgi:hypothetical protein